jgi:hypothetical protein
LKGLLGQLNQFFTAEGQLNDVNKRQPNTP